jgi:hypothetical protein
MQKAAMHEKGVWSSAKVSTQRQDTHEPIGLHALRPIHLVRGVLLLGPRVLRIEYQGAVLEK